MLNINIYWKINATNTVMIFITIPSLKLSFMFMLAFLCWVITPPVYYAKLFANIISFNSPNSLLWDKQSN